MPEALSAHDLQYMRQIAVDLLPDTCTIQARTETADASGGVVISWTTTYTDVECRLDQVRGGPIVAANWMVSLPWDQPITLSDRIMTDVLTLEPVELNTGRSWKAASRVWCRKADD
jgi:hypothetical protein